MPRFLPTLIASATMCGFAGNAIAQSPPNVQAKEIAPLLEQNRLVADVARADPNGVWDLVRRINILTTNQRDSGPSRAGSSPTPAELAQITANPALHVAYERDPAGTLALLRVTNEELQRARLRDEQAQPRRLALVVGSSGDTVWGRLATTRNDANLIAGTLATQGFELVQGGALIDPDKPHLLQAIKDFSRSIGPGTVALFYYAGHGAQSDARNFIVPTGAAIPKVPDDYDRNLVSLDDTVLRQMQQAHGRLNIIVLDACRDPSPLVSRNAAPQGPRAFKAGLAPMSVPSATSGSLVIFSTGPNQIARDSLNGDPDSPFASAFAAAVSEGGLEIREVFDRVEASVARVTDHQQEPWISYSAADKFYFNARRPLGDNVFRNAPGTLSSFCPNPGTTIKFVRPGAAVTGTYQPVDPSYPELCRISTSSGESVNLLYNLYDTKFLVDETPAKTALSDLLSGRSNRVEFDVSMHTSFGLVAFTESWARLGTEAFLIDNHYTQAVVLERDRHRTNASYASANSNTGNGGVAGLFAPKRWKIWYVPARGVIGTSELPPDGNDGDRSAGSSDARVMAAEPF
jgi:hypothetical protein